MRVVTVQSASAAHIVPWTVDADTVLRRILSNVNNVYVSFNPAATITDYTAPTADGVRHDSIGKYDGGTNATELSIQLKKGEVVYFYFNGIGSIYLYVDG